MSRPVTTATSLSEAHAKASAAVDRVRMQQAAERIRKYRHVSTQDERLDRAFTVIRGATSSALGDEMVRMKACIDLGVAYTSAPEVARKWLRDFLRTHGDV